LQFAPKNDIIIPMSQNSAHYNHNSQGVTLSVFIQNIFSHNKKKVSLCPKQYNPVYGPYKVK
jgi:hypothetical protein